ncbi:hypothetical protein XENOCAPTIV_027779, partial [Xenoophorus captivus]
QDKQRCVCVFQAGHLLEGPPGPIPLGSTVLIESTLDKEEGKKKFILCSVTSTDGSRVHTEATGFILSIGLCGSNMRLYFSAEHFKANPIRRRYVTAGDITLSSSAWDGQAAQDGVGVSVAGLVKPRPGLVQLHSLRRCCRYHGG